MNIRVILAITLLLVNFQIIAQEQLNLNGTWRFMLAKTEKEADSLSNFFTNKYDSRSFKPTPVPSNWSVLGYEEPVYRGFEGDKASEGFYLYDFKVPADWKEKYVKLHFGGVWSSAEVWLNGNFIGTHNGGYTSFSFDVDGKLKAGESNQLAVRVRQVNPDYKFDVYDDWTLGGIYRDVFLEAMPKKRWIDRLIVKTEFDELYKDAQLKINIMVGDRNKETLPGNYPSPGESYNMRVTLYTKDGKDLEHQEILVPAHTATNREVLMTMRVNNPLHWTAETPYLYRLRVELLEKNMVVHSRTEHVGFREISTAGGVFRINGQAVKLRGVNRHDEHPDVGRATTKEHWLQDIKLMKAANINYVRMAHYAHAQGFVELCDELGMYVGEEVSLGGAADLMYDASFSGAVLQRSYETVVRDINRPSIIYWSIGNEDALTSLHMASVKLVKNLDPTRPVLLPWRAEEWLPAEVDILAPHYWKPQEYDLLACRSNRPIISTEYTHSFGVDGFGGLGARWKALTKHPSGTGAAIWMWADQGIKTPVLRPKEKLSKLSEGDDYLRIDDAGWDGIVDSYRNLTRDYWETKAVYAQVYPTLNKVLFTPGEKTVSIPMQNDFDFTNFNKIKISWSIREDQKELASGSGTIEGQPHTESTFKLPLDNLTSISIGKTYYAWFIFTNPEGMEINRKAVELCPRMEGLTKKSPEGRLSVIKGEKVTIDAGEVHYVFDPKIGQLISASLKGKALLNDLRPVIWRKLDRAEVSVIGKKESSQAVNLNLYEQSVIDWNVEENQSSIVIKATVNYLVDSKNQFTTIYRYSIGLDGKLDVHYQIQTKVEVPSLPIVGMAVDAVPELNRLHWLGLGPYDAYANKQSAPILGVWGGLNKDKETSGTKVMRWVEQSGEIGVVRISNLGYLEHDTAKPETVNILLGVLGRPEKGRKADESIPQLLTNTGEYFVGEFSIELLKNNH
ncbi:glycoside hydrolase family 2 TIM barrel-domain containing protein [Flavobacterium sp.]|uniref:glycoside hydrolase family 2 TIM barrel-domain containing protein n=1 Tax=Flavobacterium sp. TaxID=239 RepID=UPI0025F3F66E|nr:glycoside hydrolase family 2 TIM barrel-domain containing protein [Flavobacterium sp.]